MVSWWRLRFLAWFLISQGHQLIFRISFGLFLIFVLYFDILNCVIEYCHFDLFILNFWVSLSLKLESGHLLGREVFRYPEKGRVWDNIILVEFVDGIQLQILGVALIMVRSYRFGQHVLRGHQGRGSIGDFEIFVFGSYHSEPRHKLLMVYSFYLFLIYHLKDVLGDHFVVFKVYLPLLHRSRAFIALRRNRSHCYLWILAKTEGRQWNLVTLGL